MNAKVRDYNRAFGANASKKRGDWLLPVPRTEALRLPTLSERATIDPTPICMAYPYNDKGYAYIHTHGHLPLHCSMTGFEISQVSVRQEQSVE